MIPVTPLTTGRRSHGVLAGGRRPCKVGLADVNTVVSTLRALRGSVVATASAVPRRRVFAILTAIVILVAIALLVPFRPPFSCEIGPPRSALVPAGVSRCNTSW